MCCIFKKKYSCQPNIGDKIEITWLPYNNGFPNENCYIGSTGVVDHLYDNGGFVLKTGHSILCVTDKKFRIKKLD